MVMGPNRRHDEKKKEDHDAREVLLAAATALFAQKGYAGTSVREIVERAGVTKPVLYYYFENKEGLFRAILEWARELQQEMLGEVLQRTGKHDACRNQGYGRLLRDTSQPDVSHIQPGTSGSDRKRGNHQVDAR